ncbi:50S ribosomal protein L25 [Halonatronum saccharophilum]|uniref:50S ribosomal protein L25 n=1 Tax=Halonatronum saccharophilum TaxID=150060 RepID=UPI0004863368|nr:50S ribosomal protein L25 [Halonatronum saccharophilum]
MERLKLKASLREQKGKGAAKRLRRKGLVPGVLYGLDREPVNLTVNAKELGQVVGGNAIIDLEVAEKENQPVMVKELQREPVRKDILHVDLYRIDLNETVVVSVPVELVGQAAGTREGGILEQILREVEIETLPTNIPEKLEADVTELEVGKSLSVSEITVEEGVTILTDASDTIATVVIPTELDLETDEEEEVTEPEVIGEDPEEEEGEEE